MHAFPTLLKYLIILLFTAAVLNAVVLVKLSDSTTQPTMRDRFIGNVVGVVTMTVQVCGDGIVHGTEQCDGAALNGSSCASLGYAEGNLSCASNCTYNVTACIFGGGFIGNASSCNATGVNALNITIGANGTTSGRYTNVYPVLFRNGTTPLFNFSYNFSKGNLTLANVTIIANATGIMVNLHGQLQSGQKKSLHLSDREFGELCVEDAEINTLADITDGCDGVGEIDFSSCIDESVGTTISGITCYDEGTRFRIDDLQYSGVRGKEGSSGSSEANERRRNRRDAKPSAPAAPAPSPAEAIRHEVTNRQIVSEARPSATPMPSTPIKSKLFDVEVTPIEKFKKVLPGEDTYAEIGLFYLGDERMGKRVDIAVYYAILDADERIIAEKLETVGVETRTTFIAKLTVPYGTVPGPYWFYARIKIGNEIAESFAQFTVLGERPVEERPLAIFPQQYVLILIFLLSIFLLVVVHHQYRLEKDLAEHHGKVSVEDFIRTAQITIREQGKR